MDIRLFTIRELAEAVRDDALWHTGVVPISKHRAASHVHNPRAAADDVVLLAAYDGGDVLAYIGLLPDALHLPGGTHKVGWLSTWWVRPGRQGGVVAARLLMTALGRYERSVGVSNFTPEAARAYEASRQFVPVREQPGVKAALRPPPAGGLLGRLGPVGKAIHRLRAAAAGVRLRRWRGRHPIGRRGLEVEYLGAIDAEAERFIAAHNAGDMSRTDKPRLDWIARWPWMLPSALPDRLDARYYFDSLCYRFVFLNVKVFAAGEMVAFVMMKIRNSEMTVPYAWCAAGREADVMTIVAHHMVELDVPRFKTFQPGLAGALRRIDLPGLRVEPASRRWLITKRWDGALPDEAVIHDGDGDNANS